MATEALGRDAERSATGSGLPGKGAAAALALVALVFSLTGAFGVILQVVWQRELSLLFGNTIEATASVLAAFLGSLAIGSALFGPIADRVKNPLRYYALLEVVIGLGALLSFASIALIGQLGVAAFRALGGESFALSCVRALLGFLLVAPATIPMGATLAALSTAVARDRRAGERIGILYGLNTLGAAIGAVAAAFWLVIAIGVRGTWLVAAVGDLAIGVVMWLAAPAILARLPQAAEGGSGGASTDAEDGPGAGGTAPRSLVGLLLLAFGSGAVILGLEVLWTRALVIHLGSHIATFALVLAIVLVGLGAGALVAGRLSEAGVDRLRWAGFASLGAAVSGFWGLVALEDLGDFMVNLAGMLQVRSYWGTMAVEALAAARVVLLPCFLGGMVFPLALREGWRRARAGSRLGALVAASTAGTLFGSLGSSMALVPALGVGRSFVALLALELLIGTVVLLGRRPDARALAAIAIAVAASLLMLGAVQPVERVLLAAGVFQDPHTRIREWHDGLHGLITVEDREDPDDPGRPYRSISVNGVNVAGTSPDLIETQKLQAHLPILLAPRARSVLHIGVGSGGTAASVALHPVERIDVVELNPMVPPAADRWFGDVNRGILFRDPRLSIHYGDGRNWLLSTDRRYDVILSDSIHPRYAGNGALYTRDYYEICRSRLEPDGIVSQWLPLYSLPPEAFAMIVRAFLEVFPDSILWYPHGTVNANSILIGARDGFDFGTASLASRLADPGVAADLEPIGIRSVEDLLSTYLAGKRGLGRLVQGQPLHTDDRPVVEFAAGRVHGAHVGNFRTWTWARNLEALVQVREPWNVAPGARDPVGRKLDRYVEALKGAAP